MPSTTITTLVKMLESLPEAAQDRVVEHLREYIDDLQDELKWDRSFQQTQSKLVAAAQCARQEIAEGQATAMEIQERKALIKESVREVLREERLLLCEVLVPSVSDEEQAELEADFGSPSDYDNDEPIDMTQWVKYGDQISQAGN